ncbi:MAG: hypothetical protein EOM20_02585 [Spartobacteria bacterium]|nr:hypothetical protein [Spartobacteria bacterium]
MKTEKILVQCCDCGKIRVDGGWVDTERMPTGAFRTSHGYCPSCLDRAIAEVQSWVDDKDFALQRNVFHAEPVL